MSARFDHVQYVYVNVEASIGPWVRAVVGSLRDNWPDLEHLIEWADSLPSGYSDLVGFEVGLRPDDVPVAMHLRVGPAAGERVVPASTVIAESGYVVEVHGGQAIPAARYVGVRSVFRQDADAIDEVAGMLQAEHVAPFLHEVCRIWPVAYLGVMDARSHRPVRVVLTVPDTLSAWEDLASVTGLDIAAARRWAQTWDSTVFVNLDLVEGGYGPTVGIELKAAGDEDLFAWCEQHVPEAGVLRAWEGVSLFTEEETLFDAEDLAALYRGGQALVTRRRLNHVKVSCAADGSTFKAYLSASREPASRVPPG